MANEPKQLTKKQNIKARKQAYNIWEKSGKAAKHFRIANDTGLTLEEVKHYFMVDKWDERYDKAVATGKIKGDLKDGLKAGKYKASQKETDQFQEMLDDSELSEQKKFFVIYYLQSYNARLAAVKAGYSAATSNSKGSMLLSDPEVKRVMNNILGLIKNNIYISTHDIINEYIKIAYADITDYVAFDGKSVQLKDSTQVDGRLITEVKQGRDGITIKLADKMKALDRLEKLFEIMPDRKLELEREKFEFTKDLALKATGGSDDARVTIINDIRLG